MLQQISRQEDRRATVIIGPRQVGKTVLLWQLADALLDHGWPPGNLTYFDFSDDRLTGSSFSPRAVVDASTLQVDPNHPRVFLFDEVGSASDWARWLKQAVDTTGHRFVVTDSAATLLFQGGQESGVGRWDEHQLESLTFEEFLRFQARGGESLEELLNDRDPVERYLACGGYPEHVYKDDLSEVRRRIRVDVADRAIAKDIQRRTELHAPGKLKDLFVYLMETSGAVFDAKSRGPDVEADKPPDSRTVDRWLAILEDTLLVRRLDLWGSTGTGRLRGRGKPKLYAADHGLVSAFSRSANPLRDPRTRGAIYEAVVFRHLRELARERNGTLSYYRSKKGDLEADFVLDFGEVRVAVEVTSSADPRNKPRRLCQAAEKIGANCRVLIYPTLDEGLREGVTHLPFHAFLLDPTRVLPEG